MFGEVVEEEGERMMMMEEEQEQQVVPDCRKRKLAELFVIYDADGTVAGELLYLVKKWFGRGHCAACVITHGPKREKPEFTDWKQRLGVVLHNIHRDEMDIDLYNATRRRPFPCVVGRADSGEYVYVMAPEELDKCDGQVDQFETRLVEKLGDVGFATETLREQQHRTVSSAFDLTHHQVSLKQDPCDSSPACLVPDE
mmetsp:Transcript_5229/g.11031  ORF Transcript_5229/g.11031 Transcript_5229/m.11031 type:complete len:198 (+) Transcript_5229:183-776(+)